MWPASGYADEITATLTKRGREVQNVQFDNASHLLTATGPGMTRFQLPGTSMTFGLRRLT